MKSLAVMAPRALISLPLLLSMLYSGALSSTILNYNNNCPDTVWVAASPTIDEGIWEFPSGTATTFETPDQWSGSIWFRTGCSGDPHFTCETGDCGSGDVQCFGSPPAYPVTLVNFSINQTVVTYEVNLIHGFNIPITVVPDGGSNACASVGCSQDAVKSCPAELLVKNSKGVGVACGGACDVFKDPTYCCTGAFAGAGTCKPNKYSAFYKQLCPLAHTHPQESIPPLGRCSGANRYLITMCASS